MGAIEQENKKQRRRENVRAALLTVVALSGVALVAAIAPMAPAALGRLPSMRRAQLRYQYRTVLGRLAAQGHIAFEQRNGKKYARITESGRHMLQCEQEKARLDLNKKRRWDKRWRVIIFDIPERRRPVRDRLRIMMDRLGFVRLQDSVWVFPYDCEDFITLLKADLKIGNSVLYLIVENIQNDKHLREHFGLSTAS